MLSNDVIGDYNNLDISEEVVRLYDLDFSDLRSLLINQDVLVIGYRYKYAGIVGVEYILLDKNNDYLYTVEKDLLDDDLIYDLDYSSLSSQLRILNKGELGYLTEGEFKYYWLLNISLEKILPSIQFIADGKLDRKGKSSCISKTSNDYVNSCVEAIDDLLNNNFTKESNKVKYYSLNNIKPGNIKITHYEKVKRAGYELVTGRMFAIGLGICAGIAGKTFL